LIDAREALKKGFDATAAAEDVEGLDRLSGHLELIETLIHTAACFGETRAILKLLELGLVIDVQNDAGDAPASGG
jgi:hypothetical protein